MAICEIQEGRVSIRLWAPMDEVEPGALQQLRNVASLPWSSWPVAAMADMHQGIGVPIGLVYATENAVLPSAVGVDIGCGMGAVKTNLRVEELPKSLTEIRLAIEAAIPTGFNSYTKPVYESTRVAEQVRGLLARFRDLTSQVTQLKDRAANQLGTLGGGNHFIELEVDLEGDVWMMLHSGSRHVGGKIADAHIRVAKGLRHNTGLPDANLAALFDGTRELDAYRHDLYWAQAYALANRSIMLERFENVLRGFFPHLRTGESVLCHHNYMVEETHGGKRMFVTRKGAIRAGQGELGIIPGSMGAKSFLVRGRGNPASYESASHGAGRVMSRGEARRKFTVADLEGQLAGIECRKDKGVLDEIPTAYKDIRAVMANQADLVDVVAEFRQVLCVKGGKED